MGAQSHDAIRLDHKHDNISFSYAYMQASEESRAENNGDEDDITGHMAYLNYAGILGGKLAVLYSYLNDGCGNYQAVDTVNQCNNLQDDLHTIGFRQAGQLYGIDYRGEYYHQWGDATATANAAGGGYTAGTPIDREAYMYGIRVGKSFNNVNMKPGITLWYDYLSGTTDADAEANKWKSFNTVYDTGHKFYGLQDVFLGIGNNSAAAGTAGFGLQDAAIKAKIVPIPGWTIKADYHWFFTAERMAGSPTRGVAPLADSHDTAGSDVRTQHARESSDLGTELDITAIHKMNANTKLMIGYANFTTRAAFRQLRGSGSADANWFYTQIHVGF
jgi:hypothetical protein